MYKDEKIDKVISAIEDKRFTIHSDIGEIQSMKDLLCELKYNRDDIDEEVLLSCCPLFMSDFKCDCRCSKDMLLQLECWKEILE